MKALCLIRRMAVTIFGVVALALTIGIVPHPAARAAQAMMYIALAIAIMAVGAAWRPNKAQA